MKIRQIRLRNFRNIPDLELQPNSRVNVLFGNNAQGKTSFLESIFALTHGKSFRTPDSKRLILEDGERREAFLIEAEIERLGLKHKLIFYNSSEQKQIVVDNKKTSAPSVQKRFCSVLFSPESLSIIKNSDQERRDLIDDLVMTVYPEQAATLNEYKKILRQRNKLLKDLSSDVLQKESRNLLYFETLTISFLRLAAKVASLRMTALSDVLPELTDAFIYITGETPVDISVDYVISDVKQQTKNEEFLYAAMYNRWLQLSSAEMSVGHSLVGSHKHDIRIMLNDKDSRYYCSQGQQRLLILAFKMAQIRVHFGVHGIYPVLLLDDVLSEIDEKKRVKLIEYLETLDAQIFLTSTENTVLNYLSRNSLSVFEVVNGKVRDYDSEQGGVSVRQFDHSRKSE
jgi:DNA replication and repair protein RecF